MQRRPRRRRRGQATEAQPASPASSEDLVRALPRERPSSLTAAPDGSTLEQIIGQLQSEWGVPQYPQEYRITVKVAEPKEGQAAEPSPEVPREPGAPRREKAPAAPRVAPAAEAGAREQAPRRRRRGGRRGRARRGDG